MGNKARSTDLSALPSLLVAAIIGLLTLGTCPLSAQGFSAALTGTVKDVSGAVLPGAAVTVKHIDTGLTRTAQADSGGSFTVPSLPVGEYEVTAEKTGFRKEVRNGINLAVGQEAVVDLTLQVGSIDQQVTVTGEAPLVNTTLSSTSGLITESQIKDMPLNGRSFDQLLTLNTGTANNTANIGQAGAAWTGFSVAGKRPETNRFMMNGVDHVGANATGQFITPSGASGQLLGVEAVREYNVIQNTYGAEYGKRAGGQINVVTSSGTNQLHGDLFEYVRNSDFDARDFFQQGIGTPPFKRNQFGAALGGPLKKDKMFLFGNWEGFRERRTVNNVATVPDNFARQGLLRNGSPVPKLQLKMLPFVQAYWPVPNGPMLPVASGQPGTAQNFGDASTKVREDFGLVRFDSILSSKDNFSANYNIDNGVRDVPQLDPIFVQTAELRTQTLSLQETRIFSPRVINVVTAGWSRPYGTLINNATTPFSSNLLFVPGGNPGSIILGGGVITASAAAVTSANGNNLVRGIREYYTVADDVHFISGRHSWSAGGWLQRIHENNFGSAQGSAANVAYPTVLAMLQDSPTQIILNRNPISVGYRSIEAAWYIQDEIKLRPNLTLRLGLRDEMTNGWHEVAGRCSNYVYDPNFVIQTDPVVGESCLATNQAKSLWQPRVGLVWDPTGTGTWSVRAGFSIQNDLQDNLGHRVYANPPVNPREQFSAKPLLSLIPFQKGVPPLPSCSPTLSVNCVTYQVGGIDPNMFTPTVQEWSFTVERQITKNLMLSVGYVGSQSYHTMLPMDTNMAPPLVCANSQGCASGGTTAGGKPFCVAPACPIVPPGTLYMAPGTRPNPYVSNTTSWFNQGTASYHSLDVSLLKRVTRGLTFKANYTYAKVIDLNSAILATSAANEPPGILTPYRLGMSRGVASFSLHHQFNGSVSYQLPFGSGQRFASGAKGFANRLVGGWQWNGIVTAEGGFPFTPLTGSNTSGTGDSSNISDTPNFNPNFKGPVILGRPDHWYDANAFLLPTQGTFGNVGRGSFRGPGLVNFDTSVFKKIPINERLNLQLRVEAFNLLNHPNFSFPTLIAFQGGSISPTAGQITGTATYSRQIQLALKLIF